MRTSKLFIIAKKDIVDTFRNKLLYFYIAIFFIFGFVYFNSFSDSITGLLEQNLVPEELRLGIQLDMDSLFVIIPLTLAMLTCAIFSGYFITMEKTKRSMESLLATPISIKQVWLGKSLAVALPSMAFALMISFLVLIGINVAKVNQVAGCYIFPTALPLVTGLVIVPLLVFLIILIVSFIQLTTANPMTGRLAFMGIFMMTFLSTTLFDFGTSKDFTRIYLIAAVLLASSIRFTERFLTEERVVLSSKG
jgi:hypothetical protein